MHRVEIYKTIWAGDVPSESEGIASKLKYVSMPYPDRVSFKYSLQLSFVPFVGLSIIDDTDSYNFRSGNINKIIWFHHEKLFACYVDDERPYSSRGYEYSYEWLLNDAQSSGWKKIDEKNP